MACKHIDSAVLIPYYNCWDLTEACVKSMISRGCIPSTTVLVNDGSTETIPKFDFGIPVFHIDRKVNEGFGPAVNAGMRFLTSLEHIKYIFLLNNDVVIMEDNWMHPFREVLESDKHVGVGAVGLGHTKTENSKTEAASVLAKYSYLGFWCIAIRKEAWLDTGELDEQFEKGYYEDRDWCYRMQDKDWSLVKLYNLDIRHINNATFDRHKINKGPISSRNHQLFKEKWNMV